MGAGNLHEKQYRQCVRCLMDTSDPEITFNKKGECNHCTEFITKKIKWTYQGASSHAIFMRRIETMKRDGRGKKYDCVVGISGGVDSCYVACVCKEAGLRVLLVHLDNGWDSETSVRNIETICNAFGMDYESHVLDWNEFSDIQLSHLKASVPEMETPTDISILEWLHKTAAKHGVKHIVMGGNYITEGILPKSWHYNAKDSHYSRAIHKQFGRRAAKNFPSFNFWEELYFKYIKGIRIFYILNYVPYSKAMALKTLTRYGWRDYGQKHHESFYTRIVQSYILPEKFNIDYRKATLSNKVCTAVMSREMALNELNKKPYNTETIDDDIEYVCKKLGITRQEFNAIMESPPKTFRDYPNSNWILEPSYKLYHFISERSKDHDTSEADGIEIELPETKNTEAIKISVIIPTYNRAEWITKTVQSVLDQSYMNLEVIVVDDGSKDNTEEVIGKINDERLKYFKTINQERGAARNYGVANSDGEYVVFLDSDDLLYPHCIKTAADYISAEKLPEIFHVAHEVRDIDSTLLETTIHYRDFNSVLIKGNPLACINVFVRRDLFNLYRFNENRRMAGFEDWELWLRIAAKHRIGQVKKISAVMINHEGRSSNNHTNREKLIEGIGLLMTEVLNNTDINKTYTGRLYFFKCSCYSYIALHLAISKYKRDALRYLAKALKENIFFVFEKRFIAVLKHLLF